MTAALPIDPELRQRNEQRARDAIARMGERYLCHPANRVKSKRERDREPRRVLHQIPSTQEEA